jgi:hypothetical protein
MAEYEALRKLLLEVFTTAKPECPHVTFQILCNPMETPLHYIILKPTVPYIAYDSSSGTLSAHPGLLYSAIVQTYHVDQIKRITATYFRTKTEEINNIKYHHYSPSTEIYYL